MMSRGGEADSVVPTVTFLLTMEPNLELPTSSEQGCKTQGSQRLSLHSFEQCPLPPASPTTFVTRVTFLCPRSQRQSSSSLDSITLHTARLSSAPILVS